MTVSRTGQREAQSFTDVSVEMWRVHDELELWKRDRGSLT